MHRLTLFFCFILGVSGYANAQQIYLTGKTMGTTYHIKVVSDEAQKAATLKTEVDKVLERINQSMSTYRKHSEISRFNRIQKPGVPFEISKDFLKVMQMASRIYQFTDGAWDGTVHPLIQLWGFGSEKPPILPPDPERIRLTLSEIGFNHIGISDQGYLIKKIPGVAVNLASIAKGYGVDQVAAMLVEKGYTDFLVEIGGEVYASGVKANGNPWIVGINTPRPDASPTNVYKAFPLKNKAFATSGDYRNFFVMDGIRYSHIIDPRTGWPISNHVISVSIVAESCTMADGLATGVMVMGPEKGLALIESLKDTECLILKENPDGSLMEYRSSGFGH